MKKLLKNLFSMEVMTVLMLLFAFACAVGTFVENDYGTLAARSFVYNQTWFELIMVILTIGSILNIIWFKMYKIKKFFIFFIHISFAFLLIGSALTRYVGFEAIMTIPESTIQNKMLSNDEYIQATLFDKDNKQLLKKDEKVLMTQLSQTDFELDLNEDINLRFKRFVPNAAEKIITVENGKPLVNLIITSMAGAKSIDLQNEKIYESKFANFSLNKEIKDESKSKIYFITKDKKVYIKSNIGLSFEYMDGTKRGTIKANEALPLRDDVIYTVAQTRFATPDFSASGKVEVVSLKKELVKKEKVLNAVIVDLKIANKIEEIALFGKGGSNEGYTKTLKLDGEKTLKLSWGAKVLELPFSIYLGDFKLERYPGSNSPSAYSSDVKVYDTKDDVTFEQTISMNNTLSYKGYKFFQSSYTMNESATILSVNKDPGVIPTYIGYALLFTGLFLSLFMKNGRFRKLANKKYELKNISTAIVLSILFLFGSDLKAQENTADLKIIKNIDINHANKLGKVLIQDYQGRIKPINSLAIEIMNKVIRKESLYGLNANQLFISMIINPREWQKLPIIKVKNDELKKLLGIKQSDKYFSFDNVYNQFGSYKFEDDLELINQKKPSQRTKFDKELIKVDERLNIIYNLFTGAFLKLFPKIEDKNNKWLDPTLAISVINDGVGALQKNEAEVIASLMDNYFIALKDANENNGSWEKADYALQKIQDYQNKYGKEVMPNSFKIDAELMFNKYNIFNNLTPAYLVLGLVLLALVFYKIFKPMVKLEKISKIFLSLFVVLFFVHTFGLALRWYVSGHAPWSNGYESMIYIAWAIVLSGIIFSKQSVLALATTSLLSGITLFVAHLSWLEPQITTLTPVLKSYWLTIHVSVITASYGFLALCALLGFLTLVFYIFLDKNKDDLKQESLKVSIKEARRINEMSMIIGIVLLVIGNFLGGIWANESWGRYWGWDPKETWTLVSILIYAVILHLQYIKGLASNFLFSALSLVAYASIVMTYFGVNYYLSGLHSYAAGDPIPIPTFVPITIIVILVLILVSFRNRKLV
ncbi:cytochrome c biogenesis protein [Arcobacter arenosus]|uniref:Cytochrome C biogenesis protein n=1 Tax=Arcobacter arenosus TaxID=2576037 RepID=A0A5R8Y025_9BACT|nr:cytochrome c biogenesis protein CcsA [Arcobacter arenosus]TLP37080.1 cytochrome C biogenesis protein [Arcobacter arenosus]